MSERIHVVVREGQKERWDDFVDEDEAYDDRSDLVRTAVERHIASETNESDLPEEMEDQFDEMMVHFERLESRISFAEDAFDSLLEHQLDSDEVESIINRHREMLEDEIERFTEETAEVANDDE